MSGCYNSRPVASYPCNQLKATDMKSMYILILSLTLALSSCVIREFKTTVDEFKVSSEKYSFVEQYDAKPGVKLNVSTSGGNITVLKGAGNVVRVSVVVTNRIGQVVVLTMEDLKKYASFRFEMKNNELLLLVDQIFRNGMSVGFIVECPAETRSILETSGGNLSVENLTGNQQLSTSGGNILCKQVEGEIAAQTSGGNIAMYSIAGNVKVETSGGNIKGADIDGGFQGQTSGGNIALSRIKGAVSIETSGGNISLEETGSSVLASTSGGHVSAGFSAIKAPVELHTSGGSVSCKVPSSSAYNIQLSGNPIDATLNNFQGKKQDDYIEGKINGGGPLLKMSSDGGVVRLSN